MLRAMTDPLALTTRTGLPDALRVLLDDYPRDGWQGHGNFGGMVQFWLQRHLMFREVLARLVAENEALLDRRVGIETYAPRLSRYGGFFLEQLHTHHHVEDSHYFPQLVALERRLERGFEMLETDHQAIDGFLNGFADGANAVLRRVEDPAAAREAVAVFHADLERFGGCWTGT